MMPYPKIKSVILNRYTSLFNSKNGKPHKLFAVFILPLDKVAKVYYNRIMVSIN